MPDLSLRNRQTDTRGTGSGGPIRLERGGLGNGQLNQLMSGNIDLSGRLDGIMRAGAVLRAGMKGDGIKELQSLVGIGPRGQDGDFGSGTEQRVKLFQRRAGLAATGEVDGDTWAALQAQRQGVNGILFEHATDGASTDTARQDGLGGGVGASETMADTDEARVMRHKDLFVRVATKYGFPPALLAAITSRETRGGNALNAEGYSRYDAQGYGLMQVDKRHHTPQGDPRSEAHVDQAAGILKDMLDMMRSKHPEFTEAQLLQAAVASYNKGPSVRNVSRIDKGTTGGDYSSDTWARARRYASLF